jgi:hypothetical protein
MVEGSIRSLEIASGTPCEGGGMANATVIERL